MIKIKFSKQFVFFCLIFIAVLMIFIGCNSNDGDDLDTIVNPETASSETVEGSEEESSTDTTGSTPENEGSPVIEDGNDDPQKDDSTSSSVASSDNSVGETENGNSSDSSVSSSSSNEQDGSSSSSVDEEKDSSANVSTDEDKDDSSSSASSPGCDDQEHEIGDVIVDHTFITERKEPDCINEGYIKIYCSGCGEVQSIEPIEKLGHDEETVTGYASNCFEHVMTDAVRCKRCEETLIASEQLPLAEHDYKQDWSCSWCDLAALKFEYYDDGYGGYAICVGPEGNARRVVIPDTVELDKNGVLKEYEVRKIAESAFNSHYEMYSLEIGKNVREIGPSAFGNCMNLTEIYDRSLMRVGELDSGANGDLTLDYGWRRDFYYEEFESNIEVIDGCVIFQDGEDRVMIGCTNDYTDFRGTSLTIPEGVTAINGFVFTKCNYISSVTIARSVKEIKQYAFYSTCSANHTAEGHDADSCKSPIDEVIMLNPDGWTISKDYVDYDPFPWDLHSNYIAWEYLVVHYKYHWLCV